MSDEESPVGRMLLDARLDGEMVVIRDGARLFTALHRAYGDDAQIVVLVPRNKHEWRKAERASRFLHNKPHSSSKSGGSGGEAR